MHCTDDIGHDLAVGAQARLDRAEQAALNAEAVHLHLVAAVTTAIVVSNSHGGYAASRSVKVWSRSLLMAPTLAYLAGTWKYFLQAHGILPTGLPKRHPPTQRAMERHFVEPVHAVRLEDHVEVAQRRRGLFRAVLDVRMGAGLLATRQGDVHHASAIGAQVPLEAVQRW